MMIFSKLFSLRFSFMCLLVFGSLTPQLAFSQDEERTAGQSVAAEAPQEDPDDIYRQLSLFGDIFERVRDQYVEEVTDKELIEHAINGMLTSLDPHSAFLNEDDFEEMQVQTKGEFGGLGIEVTMENGFVKVVSPIDDTPAYEAGIEAGDYITHLDGESVIGLSLSEAVDIMRGKIGTKIELTVRREGTPEALKIEITRDVIKINPVKSRLLKNDVAYIRITSFNQSTTKNVKDAYKDIKKEADSPLIGLVLDLRNNPGGLLDQAIGVSDLFLDKGEIVSTRGRHEADTKRDNATSGDILDGLPIVVLINGGSASASEIVSGALQDHRRAIVLGTQSFGKGSVQTVIPVSMTSAMRLTTARYYTPSGRSIQAKGIEPDILVEPAKIETIKVERFKEADYNGALDKAEQADAPAETDDAAANDNEDEMTEEEKEALLLQKDYQLSRAIDLVKGLDIYVPQKALKKHLEKMAGNAPEQETSDSSDKQSPVLKEKEDTPATE